MARWGIVPSDWDKLSKEDQMFMMAFLNVEADLSNASQNTKKGTFVVGATVEG